MFELLYAHNSTIIKNAMLSFLIMLIINLSCEPLLLLLYQISLISKAQDYQYMTWMRYTTTYIKKDSKFTHFLSDSAGYAVRWGFTLVINDPIGLPVGLKLCHCLRSPFIIVPTQHPGWLHKCLDDQYRHWEVKGWNAAIWVEAGNWFTLYHLAET